MTKPVVGFVAGRSVRLESEWVTPGDRGRRTGLASDKINALLAAGVRMADHPEQIPNCSTGALSASAQTIWPTKR
jgi:succinyl-CoA synthetase alpha subunit